jgi:prepilin peptidase CpaA
MNIILVILLIILATAVATDILYRKIPNALTLSAMVCGLTYHIYLKGLDGFIFSFEGLLLGLGLLLLFYASGVMAQAT